MRYPYKALASSAAALVWLKAPCALHSTLFLDLPARRFQLVVLADVLSERQHAFVRRDGMRHPRIAHNHLAHLERADHRRNILHATCLSARKEAGAREPTVGFHGV